MSIGSERPSGILCLEFCNGFVNAGYLWWQLNALWQNTKGFVHFEHLSQQYGMTGEIVLIFLSEMKGIRSLIFALICQKNRAKHKPARVMVTFWTTKDCYAARKSGSSTCNRVRISFSIPRRCGRSLLSQKLMAIPVCPARAVRPMRWT